MNSYQNKLALFLVIFSSFSCKSNNKFNIVENKDFVEEIVDFQIKNKSNNVIELPSIYDSLSRSLPREKEENLILIKALKKRGFKVIDWGRGNFPPLGPRIISFKLKKDSCFCEINKIYYFTLNDSLFRPSENIQCGDSLSMVKQNK